MEYENLEKAQKLCKEIKDKQEMRDFHEVFRSIHPDKYPQKYSLIFSQSTWEILRREGMYNFTDEEMESAKKGNGFICKSNGFELWLTPLFQ